MVPPTRKISAVLTLFFLAPLVAEYLLGDLPIKLLTALIVLAPLYGGAAILIRETARRTGRGWPTMLTLGAAYTLIGEGLITQSLFNHDYLKMNMHLLDHAYIPTLGIGAWWTLFMFNLHPFWSVGVSIALVESLFPAEAQTPWLGKLGDSIIALIFLLGAAANVAIGFKQNHFIASHTQLLTTAALSLLLILSAFLIRPRTSPTVDGTPPSPWITAALTFLLGMGVLYTPPRYGWAAVVALLAIDTIGLVLVAYFSRQRGWTPLHVLSIAAGGAMSYGIHAFTQKPMLATLLWGRISNTIFLAAALSLIDLAAKRISRYQAPA